MKRRLQTYPQIAFSFVSGYLLQVYKSPLTVVFLAGMEYRTQENGQAINTVFHRILCACQLHQAHNRQFRQTRELKPPPIFSCVILGFQKKVMLIYETLEQIVDYLHYKLRSLFGYPDYSHLDNCHPDNCHLG